MSNTKDSEFPSDAEFWTVVQRQFSFEEPSSRWSKYRKSLSKQLKKSNSSIGDLDSMTLKERSRIFSQIFGNGNNFATPVRDQLTKNWTKKDDSIQSINQAISLLIGYEDLKRFSRLAFDTWVLDYPSNNSKQKSKFVQFLTGNKQFNSAELEWLTLTELSYLNWFRLLEEGPWREDPRQEFIVSVINQLAILKEKKLELSSSFESIDKIWSKTLEQYRAYLPGDFLPQVIILVEGQSEELLLPKICQLRGVNLNQISADVRSCGGAKQVVRQYLNLRDVLELPIVSLLDSDVREEAEIIKDSLRDIDYLLILKDGELEDSFSDHTFIKLINAYVAKLGSASFLSTTELKQDKSRVDQMVRFWRRKKIGEFDKIEFAKVARECIDLEDIPEDLVAVTNSIQEAANAKRELRFG